MQLAPPYIKKYQYITHSLICPGKNLDQEAKCGKFKGIRIKCTRSIVSNTGWAIPIDTGMKVGCISKTLIFQWEKQLNNETFRLYTSWKHMHVIQ